MFRFFGYRSFEPEYETMKKMRALGIRTFTFMVSNNCNFMGAPYTKYQPTWIWEREYDFSLFDRNVTDILDAVPDAELICNIDLNPPQWWIRRDGSGNRFDPFYEFGRVSSLEDYRNDVIHYMQALLRHAVETFPKRFRAFALMGGKTTEWFDQTYGFESLSRIQAWKKYRREKKLPPVPVPDFDSRYSGTEETDGLLRIPALHETAIDYWKFVSRQSADTLELFIRKAREILPREIGLTLCYGYIFELWPYCQASWGQLEYERIFSMKEVDFALEPISYGPERSMGGSPCSMIPMQTLKVRGKNILNSIDSTTFTSRFPKAPGSSGGVSICGRTVEWKTPGEVVAGIRREMAFNLINGCSTWYFDMWGGWWDSESAMNALKEAKAIWDEESRKTPPDLYEILIVVDPENMYYINDRHEKSVQFVNPVRRALAKAGAPYTTCSFRDLEKMDLDSCRLLIFCHPFDLDNGKLETIRQLAEGKTVLWSYAPGAIHHGRWCPERVGEISGTAFGTRGMHETQTGKYRSVYLSEPETLTEQEMRRIMKNAGVHIWCEASVPVYANSRLAAVHIGNGNSLELVFPSVCRRITELYSGKTYENTDRIAIETNGAETLLFLYGDEE